MASHTDSDPHDALSVDDYIDTPPKSLPRRLLSTSTVDGDECYTPPGSGRTLPDTGMTTRDEPTSEVSFLQMHLAEQLRAM